MNIKAIPYILLTGFCFGSSLVGSRFALGQFDPLTFVTLRITIAATAFLLVYIASSKRRFPTGVSIWWHGLVLAVISVAVPMYGLVTALSYLSSGVTSIINTTGPAVTVLLAHFFLQDERLTPRTIIGILLALGGALLLALRGESGLGDIPVNPVGYLLIFVSLISISLSTIYARRYTQSVNPVDITSVQMFVAAIIVLPLHWLIVGFDLSRVNATGVIVLLYGALIGTFTAFSLYFYNVRRFGATTTAMTPYVVPVVAAIGGVLLLNEQVTAGMLIGVIIIALGIWTINSRNAQTAEQSA